MKLSWIDDMMTRDDVVMTKNRTFKNCSNYCPETVEYDI